MEKIILGVSYGATIEKYNNLKEFVGKKFDLIEIPIIDDTKRIIEFCIQNNLKVALHMPNSFNPKRSIDNLTDVDSYIKSLSNILQKYNIITNIEYIIVHFPFINISGKGFGYDLNYAVNKLDDMQEKYSTNIYIENVSINEEFFSHTHYKNILKNKKIKMCYDIGHAHVINNLIKQSKPDKYVDKFFNKLKDNIECIHYYNTTNKECNNYKVGEHYSFDGRSDENDGFMNYKTIMSKIKELKNLKYITVEIRRKEYLKNSK